MEQTQTCFVIGCPHEVITEISGHPFCFFHGEHAKPVIKSNAEYFNPPKSKKELDLELPKSDQNFILSHLNGCNCAQLSRHLTGGDTSSFSTNVKKGRIKATKQAEVDPKVNDGIPSVYYLILASEIIRQINLCRNWVTVASVARKIEESPSTLRQYAIKGKFGPIRHNVSGRLCIHKNQVANLSRIKSICSQEKERSRATSGQNNRLELKKNEICAKDFSDLIGISYTNVLIWIKKEYLNAEKRKKVYVISIKDINEFRALVRSGMITMWDKNRKKIANLINSDIDELFYSK